MQGLIKYHGMRNEALRLPYHDSISVATAPLVTRTTFEFGDFDADSAVVDGSPVSGRPMERIESVVNHVRKLSGTADRFRMVSESDFPSGVGLGASSSGFAALATASASAAGLELHRNELSALSRLGAGSATRSVAGGFARWGMGSRHENSYAWKLAGDEVPLTMIIAMVQNTKQTEDAHREAVRSPLFPGRLSYLHSALADMEDAIALKDVTRIGELAEADTLSLHAITMSGPGGMIFWKPETLSVIAEVRRLRKEGCECHFSIDTGATVYINCRKEAASEVEKAVRGLGLKSIRCTVGGPSRLSGDHLF